MERNRKRSLKFFYFIQILTFNADVREGKNENESKKNGDKKRRKRRRKKRRKENKRALERVITLLIMLIYNSKGSRIVTILLRNFDNYYYIVTILFIISVFIFVCNKI